MPAQTGMLGRVLPLASESQTKAPPPLPYLDLLLEIKGALVRQADALEDLRDMARRAAAQGEGS